MRTPFIVYLTSFFESMLFAMNGQFENVQSFLVEEEYECIKCKAAF